MAQQQSSRGREDKIYARIEEDWRNAIMLSVYDDRDVLLGLVHRLRDIVGEDLQYVPARALLADLLLALGEYSEARNLLVALSRDVPANSAYDLPLSLSIPGAPDDHIDSVFAYLTAKWRERSQ